MKVGIVGVGAFGASLVMAFTRAGREVVTWSRAPDSFMRSVEKLGDLSAGIVSPADGSDLVPGPVLVPGTRRYRGTSRTAEDLGALAGVRAILLVLPAQATAGFLAEHGAALPPGPPLVLCAKGIDATTSRLQSEIVAAALPGRPLAVLTGPGFATEIAMGLPTALTLACADPVIGRRLQEELTTRALRLYLSDDVVGAQLGGALKNVVAIGCGMVEGAGLGHSARAALMTRGFAEMTRLAVTMGARAETLAGLSGLGDLSLTCNSAQSRNFALGQALGAGASRPGGTVEGVATARAACQLGARLGVETPIAAAVADVLDGTLTLGDAIGALLARPLKEE